MLGLLKSLYPYTLLNWGSMKFAGAGEQNRILISTKELAERICMSVSFVTSHRNHIIGGAKMGGSWRFNVSMIESRLNRGLSIFTEVLLIGVAVSPCVCRWWLG